MSCYEDIERRLASIELRLAAIERKLDGRTQRGVIKLRADAEQMPSRCRVGADACGGRQ